MRIKLFQEQILKLCEKMYRQNVTAEILQEKENYWKNRKKIKKGCNK